LKAFRAPIARDLFAVSRVEGFAFDVELLVLARHWRLSVTEVPVVMRPAQQSSVRIYRHALRIARDLAWLQVRQLRGLPERPVASERSPSD
jgi:dolichyl-phosphate beta-glucosyltransferase